MAGNQGCGGGGGGGGVRGSEGWLVRAAGRGGSSSKTSLQQHTSTCQFAASPTKPPRSQAIPIVAFRVHLHLFYFARKKTFII